MVNKEANMIRAIDVSTISHISIGQAYKLALRAKNNKETRRANEILAIISRTIKEDGKNGCFTGKVRFIGTNEHELIDLEGQKAKN